MKTVCIANAADFDRMGRWNDPRPWGAMRRRVGRSLRRFGLKAMPGSWAFTDMALFWSRLDCLVIAPPGLDPALITYCDRLMDRNRTQVVPLSRSRLASRPPPLPTQRLSSESSNISMVTRGNCVCGEQPKICTTWSTRSSWPVAGYS